MREWLGGCVAKLERQPPSARRDQALAMLRQDLERYALEAPRLRVIEGGRERRDGG
jgi:hypothetical protein